MGSPGTRTPLQGMERPLPGGEHRSYLRRGTRSSLRRLREDCHLLNAGDTVLPQALWAQGGRLRANGPAPADHPLLKGCRGPQ